MGLSANNKGDGDFMIAPEGMHQAVCYGVVDIGTQEGSFNGKPKFQHKCVIIWEFAKLKMEDGRPLVISNFYTVSLSEKSNLYKHLKGWRGSAFSKEELEGFDLARLIGKNCIIQVIHNDSGGKTYANVENVTPLMEGMPQIQAENAPIDYEMTPGYIPEGMYDWIADKIRASEEWNNPDTDEVSQAPDEVSDVEPF